MILHCNFDLHFFNNEQCWASFHMFISHLYVFFGKEDLYVFRSLLTFWLDCLFFWYWAAWAACIFWRFFVSLQADSLPSEPLGKPKRKVKLRHLPVGSGGLREGREGEDSKVSKLVWGHICACGLRWGTREKLVSGWVVVMYSQGRQKWLRGL